jgi:hypothetical protein
MSREKLLLLSRLLLCLGLIAIGIAGSSTLVFAQVVVEDPTTPPTLPPPPDTPVGGTCSQLETMFDDAVDHYTLALNDYNANDCGEILADPSNFDPDAVALCRRIEGNMVGWHGRSITIRAAGIVKGCPWAFGR